MFRTTAVVVLLIFLIIQCIIIFYMIVIQSEKELQDWPRTASRNISYYLNPQDSPKICPKGFCKKTFLVIIVHSAAGNFGSRTAIREAWGNPMQQKLMNVSVFFLVGLPPVESVQFYLNKEIDQHDDIIQERFIDTYFNLTLKSIAMLRLVSSCPLFSYLMKSDDDIFINVPLLVKALKKKKIDDARLLVGSKERHSKKITDALSKWYTPSYMYEDVYYPDFLLGSMGYVMSRQVAKRLYEAAMSLEYFHLEDVFITGMCSRQAKITPRASTRFKSQDKFPADLCELFNRFTMHYMRPNEIISATTIMDMITFSCKILGRIREIHLI